MLPAKDILYPPAPYRANNRLHFTLCKKCSETLNKDPCTHSDEEREYTVAYVSPDLYACLDMNYTLKEVYEVWAYSKFAKLVRENEEEPRNEASEDETDDDKIRQPYNAMKEGLFSEFILSVYKNKIEASGYPASVDVAPSEEMKQAIKEQYIEQIREHEGIELDPEKLEEKNAGARAVSKLIMNSFFGKNGLSRKKIQFYLPFIFRKIGAEK